MAEFILGTQNDDILVGDKKPETIKGRGGNDSITGSGGDDIISGGRGDDLAQGGTGNDIIYGGGLPGGGNKSILIKEAAKGQVTFMGEDAGYRSSIGMYEIAADGSVVNARMLFANASLEGSGGSLQGGVSAQGVEWKAGAKYGFFILSDGYSVSGKLLDKPGAYVFKAANGKDAANVNANAPLTLWHIDAATGRETQVKGAYGGQTFHSIGLQGEGRGLNGDGLDHSFLSVDAKSGQLVVAFEDLINGGDKDYNDAVIRLEIGAKNADRLMGIDSRAQSEDDILSGGTGNDTISGGRGQDMLYGESGNDKLSGGTGKDQLWGGNGKDAMSGNDGADSLWGDNGDDTLLGGKDDDFLSGGAGKDLLDGNSGNDMLEGGNGDDDLKGGTGDDTLDGGNGKDTLSGGSGNDRFYLSHGKDQYDGGAGADTIDGSRSDKRVSIDLNNGPGKGANEDRFISVENILGSKFDDNLRGNHLGNAIDGGAGADRIVGGRGGDRLTGGEGEDNFTYTAWVHLSGDTGKEMFVDVIADFQKGDALDFSALFLEHGKGKGHGAGKGKPVEPSVTDIVKIDDKADGSHVYVLDGKDASWHEAAVLTNVHGLTVKGLFDMGDLIV